MTTVAGEARSTAGEPARDAVYDVVVVGAGAAGLAAARAARAAGAARVCIAAADEGATAMGAGWIATASGAALDDGALAWLGEAPALRAPGRYTFATPSGAVAHAVSGLASLLDLASLPGEGALGVVDLVVGAAWPAELVADSLREHLGGREVRVVAAAGDHAPHAASTAELARTLDAHGAVDALAASVREGARGCAALLFPPVLGLLRDDVATRLGEALARAAGRAVRVGEAGGAPRDPTATRLSRALASAAVAHGSGVARVRGRATVAHGSGAARVRVEPGDGDVRDLAARAVVLATGGLAGGGVTFDTVFVEPCARAPVWLPRGGGLGASGSAAAARLPVPSAERGMDPWPLFAPDGSGAVAALTAGVALDDAGRVVAPDGRSALEPWLFAAGDVVWGRRASSGTGGLADALLAGELAGRRAAEYARADER